MTEKFQKIEKNIENFLKKWLEFYAFLDEKVVKILGQYKTKLAITYEKFLLFVYDNYVVKFNV